MLITILKWAATVIIGYLMGNAASGLIITRLYSHKDVRQFGSGSSGATNVTRTSGLLPGALTFLADLMKGFLASMLGYFLCGVYGAMVGGLCAVIGHNWPALFKFKGGRGVAASLGTLFWIQPLVALAALVASALSILAIRVVSIVSLGVTTLVLIYNIIFNYTNVPLIIYLVVLTALMYYSHRENIKRILNGTEAKITPGKR